MYLTAPRYRTGDPVPLLSCTEIAADEDLYEFLSTLGLQYYCVSTIPPSDLAILAATDTLKAAGVDRNEVDAVVYASSSFWNPEFHRRREVGRMLDTLRLVNAYPVGVTLSECANFPVALRIGRALLADGCRHVLLIVVDCISRQDSRIVPPQISVKSDAAASCLLSRTDGDFQVEAIAQLTRPDLWATDISEELEFYMHQTNQSLQHCVAQVLDMKDVSASDLDLIITNNYNSSVTRSYANLLGVPTEKIYAANIARIAHAVAADNLINLTDAQSELSLGRGSSVLTVSAGQNLWGAALLRKT